MTALPPVPDSLLGGRPLRRDVLAATALAAAWATGNLPAAESDPPRPAWLDSHVHFYDPRRPQGVPWPASTDPVLFRTLLPEHFLPRAEPLGIAGAIVVEASAWDEDNEWLLDLAERTPFVKGVVGRLSPADPHFGPRVRRLARRPKYRGIRLGQAELRRILADDEARARFGALVDLDLTLDLNGPPETFRTAAQAAALWPSLRIVVDHLGNPVLGEPAAGNPAPGAPAGEGAAPPASWTEAVRAAADHERIYCKLSGLAEAAGRNGREPPRTEPPYRPILDAAFAAFGADRLLFGSNWPVSEKFLPLDGVVGLVATYLAGKTPAEAAAIRSGTAARAYKLPPPA